MSSVPGQVMCEVQGALGQAISGLLGVLGHLVPCEDCFPGQVLTGEMVVSCQYLRLDMVFVLGQVLADLLTVPGQVGAGLMDISIGRTFVANPTDLALYLLPHLTTATVLLTECRFARNRTRYHMSGKWSQFQLGNRQRRSQGVVERITSP